MIVRFRILYVLISNVLLLCLIVLIFFYYTCHMPQSIRLDMNSSESLPFKCNRREVAQKVVLLCIELFIGIHFIGAKHLNFLVLHLYLDLGWQETWELGILEDEFLHQI